MQVSPGIGKIQFTTIIELHNFFFFLGIMIMINICYPLSCVVVANYVTTQYT